MDSMLKYLVFWGYLYYNEKDSAGRPEEMEAGMKKVQNEDEIIFKQRKRWVFLGLPFTFTVYTIKDDVITVNTGFFNKMENDCYMYKVQDVQHSATLFERICGLGTVVCFTGDTTHPKLMLQHIKRSRDIKNYILDASEKARMKRRTMNMLDIGIDMDDIDDNN